MANQPNRNVVDDIEDVVRSHVLAMMPLDPSGELSTMPLRRVLGLYWTWRERFPAPGPRAVHRSREFGASPRAQQYASELAELVRKMEAGDDLTPHLSERVETAFISEQHRPGVHRSRRDADHDRMLAAWGIHHIHLSSAPGPGRFTARSQDLLYAAFRPRDAYLLGIYTHDDWARKELVEVIVRNWPNAGLFLKSNYAVGTSTQFSDDNRRTLRRVGVNEGLIEVDGAFCSPASIGMTATGSSVSADRRAMGYMENLRQLRENLDDRLSAFGKELDQAAGHVVTGDWTPGVHEDNIGIFRGDDAFIGIPWLDVD